MALPGCAAVTVNQMDITQGVAGATNTGGHIHFLYVHVIGIGKVFQIGNPELLDKTQRLFGRVEPVRFVTV